MEYRQALVAGTLLAGEYRIAATLRQDGFCITYDAEDLQLKSHVLVKEYFPGEIAERVRQSTIRPKSTRQVNMLSWSRQRFIEEAQTLTKFSHSGIARVKRVFEENNTAYAVIDAQDWPTLISWVDKLHRPLTQNELDQIAKQFLDSLEVLHEAGVLTRDLSPETIHIRDKRYLMLVDFGTAKAQFSARARKMHAVVRPGYSAPEQYLFDDGEQGPWTDIFSLGAVLDRLVTGRSPIDVIHRHSAEDMQKAAASGTKAHRIEYLQAIDRCLALDTKARPQSIKALRTMLLGAGDKSAAPIAESRPSAQASRTQPAPAAPRSDEQGKVAEPSPLPKPTLPATAPAAPPVPETAPSSSPSPGAEAAVAPAPTQGSVPPAASQSPAQVAAATSAAATAPAASQPAAAQPSPTAKPAPLRHPPPRRDSRPPPHVASLDFPPGPYRAGFFPRRRPTTTDWVLPPSIRSRRPSRSRTRRPPRPPVGPPPSPQMLKARSSPTALHIPRSKPWRLRTAASWSP